MVSSLPLPPTQRTLDTGVLTSEAPSPAPVVTKERTEPPPAPNEVAIPEKITKPIKTAEKAAPTPPKYIQPVTPPPTKAVTGETAGIRIAQSTLEVKNGTASVSVEDRTFGERFAYYVNIVNSKVAQNWYTAEADPRASIGKSTTIIFDINREGVPLECTCRDAQRLSQSRYLGNPSRATSRRLRASASRRSYYRRIHLSPASTIVGRA